jgi:wyosine [tRNA(Phe)-imidazoG37] synthetase (radical SAM superfamily)
MPYAEAPRFIQLETVTACNGRCPFCPQHEIRREPARMPDAVWRQVVADTRGLGITYRPFLTNEPLIDRRLPEIVHAIKRDDATARVELNTNGELLTEPLARALLEAGLDSIRFSIDGFTPETFAKSRVGVSHAKVYERVPRFLEIWDREGYRESCHTEVRMIETPDSRPEIDRYRTFWSGRCHEVVVTTMYQWPWTGQEREDVVLKPCLKILDEMFFYTNGNATLCCWDVHERAVIGSVRKDSVLDIWNGHAARHLRALLNDGRRDLIQLCSRCNAYGAFDFAPFANPGRTPELADDVGQRIGNAGRGKTP